MLISSIRSDTAVADDGAVNRTYRHLWTLPPADNPAGVSWIDGKGRGITAIWPLSDGGHSVWAYETPHTIYNIKLDADGVPQFWMQYSICPHPLKPCNGATSNQVPIIRMPDGGATIQIDEFKQLVRVGPDGYIDSIITMRGYMHGGSIKTLFARDGSIYLAGSVSYAYGGLLVRLAPDGTKLWELFLPLSLDGHGLRGEATHLTELTNGDVEWGLFGRSDYPKGLDDFWTVTVSPDGTLRQPERFDAGLPSLGDNLDEPDVLYLQDGRLLRHGAIESGPDEGLYRLEFRDGIRDRAIATRLVDLRIRANHELFIGSSAQLSTSAGFYLVGFDSSPPSWLFGFDATGGFLWRFAVLGTIRPTGRDAGEFYVHDIVFPEPDGPPVEAIYLLNVE